MIRNLKWSPNVKYFEKEASRSTGIVGGSCGAFLCQYGRLSKIKPRWLFTTTIFL